MCGSYGALQCYPLSTGQVRLAAHYLDGSVPFVSLSVHLHPDVLVDPLHPKSKNHHPPAPLHQSLHCHPYLPYKHFSYKEPGKYFWNSSQSASKVQMSSNVCDTCIKIQKHKIYI